MHFFRNFMFPRPLPGSITRAPFTLELHALDGQRTHTEGISESCRDHFEVIHALGIRLLVNAIKRWNSFLLQISGDAFVRGQHELFNDSVRAMLFINPNSSNSITGSGRSKSIEPRRWRL